MQLSAIEKISQEMSYQVCAANVQYQTSCLYDFFSDRGEKMLQAHVLRHLLTSCVSKSHPLNITEYTQTAWLMECRDNYKGEPVLSAYSLRKRKMAFLPQNIIFLAL